MDLIIAEKPSVARAIADVVGTPTKVSGGLISGDFYLTWCFGHLYSLLSPEELLGRQVVIGDLPLVPEKFTYKPKDDSSTAQIAIIKNLLQKATSVIHAGDPDREGQLLVDLVLQHLGWRGVTKRLWLSAMDHESIKQAMSNLRSSDDVITLSQSAQGRSFADWLVGMNLSIAISRKVRERGGFGAWSIGRVQTPTLGLVVAREAELKTFKAQEHYGVDACIESDIVGHWDIPKDCDGLNADGLLVSKSLAVQVSEDITAATATVTKFTKKTLDEEAPLPYALSDLQKIASSKLGMPAAKTLEVAQSLYEAGVLSYPRTDCRYLPREQHADGSRILSAIAIQGADPSRVHRAWDSSKVTAHHAIIPTGKLLPESASKDEVSVFNLVRVSYGRLFFPPEHFERRVAVFNIAGNVFTARSKTQLSPGWTAFEKPIQNQIAGSSDDDTENEEDAQNQHNPIPDLAVNQELVCLTGKVVVKNTKPPSPYTDGTLVYAMSHVYNIIEDQKSRAKLKETSGIGTEATRAGILEALIAREYIFRNKKELRPTEKGIRLITWLKTVAPSVVDPVTTATWEDALSSIVAGDVDLDFFISKQAAVVGSLTNKIINADISPLLPPPFPEPCPICKSVVYLRKGKTGTDYLACSNQECKAAFAVGDNKISIGRQFVARATQESTAEGPPCTRCKKPTGTYTTAKGAVYYRCAKLHGAWWDDNGKLGKRWPPKKKPAK